MSEVSGGIVERIVAQAKEAPATVARTVEPQAKADPSGTPPEGEKQAEDPRMSARFREIARREKAVVERERASKEDAAAARADAAAARAEAEAARTQIAEYEELKKEAKRNPVAFMAKHDLSYEELTRFMLNGDKPSTEDELARLEQKLDADREERKKKAEEDDTKKREAEARFIKEQIDAYKTELTAYINQNEESFELITLNNAHDVVFELVEGWYNDTGEILEPARAAELVEQQLEEEARKVLGAKKFSTAKAEEPIKDTPKKDVRDNSRPSRTLTNRQVISSAPPANGAGQSASERLARAKAVLAGGRS